MAYLGAVSIPGRRLEGRVRTLLYKADHPRFIDQYIDFFGDGRVQAEVDIDCCGDRRLESFA